MAQDDRNDKAANRLRDEIARYIDGESGERIAEPELYALLRRIHRRRVRRLIGKFLIHRRIRDRGKGNDDGTEDRNDDNR